MAGRGGGRAEAPSGGRDLVAGLLIALGLWLAWQAVRPALGGALPVAAALRIDGGSPDVLARAAEASLIAGRREAAANLARLSLRKAPFNARALRVLGLAVAADDPEYADHLIGLAGDWSLRDDPAHVWLMTRRAEQGRYAEALASADLLARRREDLNPQLFAVFDAFAASDAGAAMLAQRLAARPNWRPAYLGVLAAQPDAAASGARLAAALERTRAPMTDQELGAVYAHLLQASDLAGLRDLRQRLARPKAALLTDGDFPARPSGPEPFAWQQAGTADVLPAPGGREGTALRLTFDGFTAGVPMAQVTTLPAGAYRLTGTAYWEGPAPAERPAWRVLCQDDGAPMGQAAPGGAAGAWTRFAVDFAVPAEGCLAQQLRLETPGGERRLDGLVWYDHLEIARR